MRLEEEARGTPAVAPVRLRTGTTAALRHVGILGFPFSRLPLQDSSYSSLDNVTWSTARALRRRGSEVVIRRSRAPAEPGD